MQDYCQLKVLMVYSCRTDSALSVLLFLHPSAFSHLSPSLSSFSSSLPILIFPLVSNIQRSSLHIDLYVIPPTAGPAWGIKHYLVSPNKHYLARSMSKCWKYLTLNSPWGLNNQQVHSLSIYLLTETLTCMLTISSAKMTSTEHFNVSGQSDFHSCLFQQINNTLMSTCST